MIEGVLPTFLAVSSISAGNVLITLIGFVVFYSTLAVVDVYLMVKTIKAGPARRTAATRRSQPTSGSSPPNSRNARRLTMIDYETLRLIWWALLGVLLIGFAIMDGFDLGIGMLLPFVGRTDAERRVAINTVGPVWEGNQVWLILGGGAIFAAWPPLYAVAFSGFYLAMFLVLCALILRPVGFKFRSKVADPRWRTVWDWALFVGGLVPALIFGVAFGNLLPRRAVPLRRHAAADLRGQPLRPAHPFALLSGLEKLGSAVDGYREGPARDRRRDHAERPQQRLPVRLSSQDGAGTRHGFKAIGGWKFGNTIDGCQAEYVLRARRHGQPGAGADGLTDEQVLMCPDIMSTGFCGAESGGIRIGDTVAVFAQGPIGLCADGRCEAHGRDHDHRRRRGAPSAWRWREDASAPITSSTSRRVDPVEEIMRLTDGRGVDVAIEALGTQATFEGAARAAAGRHAVEPRRLFDRPDDSARRRSPPASATTRSSPRSAPAARSACAG